MPALGEKLAPGRQLELGKPLVARNAAIIVSGLPFCPRLGLVVEFFACFQNGRFPDTRSLGGLFLPNRKRYLSTWRFGIATRDQVVAVAAY